MEFSPMFFAAADQMSTSEQYDLVLDVSRRAEALGCLAIWVPERHFDPFGEAFPSPLLILAAIAAQTDQIGLRAGSLVTPLHDTVRVFEDWSMLDNLSRGRCALSFGSGWNANDFVFAPERFQSRRKYMWHQMSEILEMWDGGPVHRANGSGTVTEVTPRPRPYSQKPEIWITNSGNKETTVTAAQRGASILTHLIGKSLDDIRSIVDLYRASQPETGPKGRVSLMLHTCITENEAALARAKGALRRYLRRSIHLENKAAVAAGSVSGGHRGVPQDLDSPMIEELLDISTEKTVKNSLIGPVHTCRNLIETVRDIGVDEVCCLLDFGISRDDIFRTLDLIGAHFIAPQRAL